MKEWFIDVIKSLSEYVAGNTFINKVLIDSVFYLDYLDHPNFGLYLFVLSCTFSAFLIFYLFKQILNKNFFYSFFLLLPLILSGVSTYSVFYFYQQEKNESISTTIKLNKPNNITRTNYSVNYYFGNDYYKVSNKCLVDLNKDLNIYITSRKFEYFYTPFDQNCRFIKYNKDHNPEME